MPLLIFTDVDGTLIDFDTYEPGPVRGVLERCRHLGVPVMPVTSKSAVEIIGLRARLDLTDPFAVENGAAIWVPGSSSVAAAAAELGEERGFTVDAPEGFLRVIPGADRADLVAALERIGAGAGFDLHGLQGMDVEEVAERTGLSPVAAASAADREFSEPFLVFRDGRPLDADERVELLPEMRERARREGLTCMLGGRFFHLLGKHTKGTAVRLLIDAWKRSGPGTQMPVSMALGDAHNDTAMFAEVDHPVLVARPDGTHARGIEMPGLELVGGIGPVGWSAAVGARLDALAPAGD